MPFKGNYKSKRYPYKPMKLGVISDTHDHLPNVKKAISLFIQNKVAKIIHCGDIVAPFISRSLKDLHKVDIEMIGVFGNNDGERDHMNRLLGGLMTVKGDFIKMELGGKKIAIYHGTISPLLHALIECQQYDLVLTGHTHEIRIEKHNRTLLLNPGEACGYLSGKATCAIVNLDSLNLNPEDVQIFNLDEI